MAGDARKSLERQNERLLEEKERWRLVLERIKDRYTKNHQNFAILGQLFHWTPMKGEDGQPTAAVSHRPKSDPVTKRPFFVVPPIFFGGKVFYYPNALTFIPFTQHISERRPYKISVAKHASTIVALLRAKDFQKLYGNFKQRKNYHIHYRTKSDTVIECAQALQAEQKAFEFLFEDIQKTKIADIDKQLGRSSGDTSAKT